MNLNKHTPERFPTESQAEYRARRHASHEAARRDRFGTTWSPKGDVLAAFSKNGGRTGAGMASVRAARKARNVRRFRAASRG